MYVSSSDRVILSRLWWNKSGLCTASRRYIDFAFLLSVCCVCGSNWYLVYDKSDDRAIEPAYLFDWFAFSASISLDCVDSYFRKLPGEKYSIAWLWSKIIGINDKERHHQYQICILMVPQTMLSIGLFLTFDFFSYTS